MDKPQAITLVREAFTQRFGEVRFLNFVRNLVNHLDESKNRFGRYGRTLSGITSTTSRALARTPTRVVNA